MAATANRLRDDTCERDWIWEREIEAAPWEETRRLSVGAWERQFRRLRESSPFYARKWREAGVGSSFVSLADLSALPFTTKEELKGALDEDPPFGANLCVAPEQVKRVYQTSGTSGAPSVLGLTRGDMETWTVMGTRTYYATGIHEHSSVLTTFGAGPFVAGHTHFVLLRIGPSSTPRVASPWRSRPARSASWSTPLSPARRCRWCASSAETSCASRAPPASASARASACASWAAATTCSSSAASTCIRPPSCRWSASSALASPAVRGWCASGLTARSSRRSRSRSRSPSGMVPTTRLSVRSRTRSTRS